MKQNKKKNWYVFYTCPRAEKKVNKYLLSLGYETFLPLKKEVKVWKNRQRKVIETPLFPSYIFINIEQCNIFETTKIYGICYCVSCNGVPAYISDEHIQSLKIMQNMNITSVSSEKIFVGDKIRVLNGPLCGYEGILIKMNGINKFGINIDCTNLIAMVDLNISKIERI